ncbi:DUF1924 domain-containing protein [Imhoffiella purpurea]|uniref:Cytochrome c-type protein Shp n=1 Tax=Imhoffiella purpurea TaxID=1249627 RepID=W9V844_9GAMM|nr:DUF1924 domain-containing protein [Imhoffiella purpurea]EXJ15599.1 cytochrome c-type protein Shp [Imhoffiella purpurea]
MSNPPSTRGLLIALVAAGTLSAPGLPMAADPAAGAAAWIQEHPASDGTDQRSCATCHGTDLTQPGRHAKTGKAIDPMAPSVNPQRLTDEKKIAKWLLRNCRWTLGRECTETEKADFIAYIETQ